MNREMQMLEKVWMAEVENRLPFQTRAAMIKRLAAQGLVQPMETMVGKGHPQVRVTGWQLTHAGRVLYCSTCDAPQPQGDVKG